MDSAPARFSPRATASVTRARVSYQQFKIATGGSDAVAVISLPVTPGPQPLRVTEPWHWLIILPAAGAHHFSATRGRPLELCALTCRKSTASIQMPVGAKVKILDACDGPTVKPLAAARCEGF